MDAILTKYHGPTSSRGGRIVASRPAANNRHDYGRCRLTYAYDHSLPAYENHAIAARALWAKTAPEAPPGRLVGGQTGDGWAWVWAPPVETHLREVARAALECLANLTTKEFSRGGDRPARIALAEALDLNPADYGL